MTILSFILGSGIATLAGDEPHPIKHFTDLTGRTARRYGEDLEGRLARYAQKTGYSIHIVITDEEILEDLAREYFRTNDMEAYGSNASIVVVVSPKMRRIDVASSENFRGKFDNRNARGQLDFKFRHQISSSPRFIERFLQAIVEILDPWFYELDPPKFQTVNGPSLAHSPTGEVVMFLLAPFLGVLYGNPVDWSQGCFITP